jgi:hypothetical protein
MSDPNHANYIKALSVEGYKLPTHRWITPNFDGVPLGIGVKRMPKTIIMQDYNPDVPGCVKLPIDRMIEEFCNDETPYFTSTFAHMLVYALLGVADNGVDHRWTDIFLYGWEMESDTEYAHQRACAEYWIGYGRALGIKIEAPGANILKGEHYAYESNWQGYRTRLELRKQHLRQQLQMAEGEAIKSEGALNAITPFKAIPEVTPAFDLHFDEHFKRKGFVSFLRGTLQELDNAIAIYDAYYVEGKGEPPDVGKMLALTYELG